VRTPKARSQTASSGSRRPIRSRCDLSPNALAHAGATGAYERVVEVDLQQLPIPFPDDAFDALNCVGVLTYLPHTKATLREFLRLVRPGGTIAFSQREDVWVERGCHALIEGLVTEGACEALHVSEPRPYLPKSDEMSDVGAVLCILRKLDVESPSLRG